MNVAIVVAGGKGTRFGGNRPKQFLTLNGIPVIIHTLRQFERCEEIDEVIVVLPAEETAVFQSLAQEFGGQKLSRLRARGAPRAQSVRCGFAAIAGTGHVAL